jgi:hypothetical protein
MNAILFVVENIPITLSQLPIPNYPSPFPN